MLIYLLLIMIIFLFWHFSQNRPEKINYFFYILCFLFTFVAMIRYNVGTDYYHTYINLFNQIKLGYEVHYEILFLLLNKLLIFIKFPPFSLLSICSFITIPLFFRFVKNNIDKKYYFLSILLFELIGIYFATMNLVRQYIAISILIVGFDYLKDSNYFKYAICILIACLFHSTGCLGIILLIYKFIENKKFTDKFLLIIYFISLIFLFIDVKNIMNIFYNFIPERYQYLFEHSLFMYRNYKAILKVFYPNLLLIILFIYKKNLRKEYKNFNLYFLPTLIYVVIYNIFYGMDTFLRIGYYFDYFLLIIIPIIMDYFNKNDFFILKKKIKNFGNIFIIFTIFYFSLLITYGVFISNGHGVMPYKTVFNLESR